MRLVGSQGIELVLDVVGYQFPGITDSLDDANWLRVSGALRHPRGDWHFEDPCLTTHELEHLAEWFEGVANGNANPDDGYFTEPCLHFRLEHEPEAAISLQMAYECAPPWVQGDDRFEGIILVFPLAMNDPHEAARAVRKMLSKFPKRRAGGGA